MRLLCRGAACSLQPALASLPQHTEKPKTQSALPSRRAKRSLQLAGARPAPPPALAGASRKRLDAELVSPPLPRKSSRTVDGEQAAELMLRLQLGEARCGGP